MQDILEMLQSARRYVAEAELKNGTSAELDKAWWAITNALNELARGEECE